jgi:hypothetical protein
VLGLLVAVEFGDPLQSLGAIAGPVAEQAWRIEHSKLSPRRLTTSRTKRDGLVDRSPIDEPEARPAGLGHAKPSQLQRWADRWVRVAGLASTSTGPGEATDQQAQGKASQGSGH